ncbi:MAG: hypothetical protein KJ593_07715 [Candidatus Omnitrophica bacterium]|nr:hypothetical protein [Candidatus Omnitrophota bacterium]
MDKMEILANSTLQLVFPLEGYGYFLKEVLNNKNRWHTKIVCSILNGDSRQYVSTTYAKLDDYLRLLEITTYLKCINKICPEITMIYPKDKTVICDYIGEFLSDYLLNNPSDIIMSLTSVYSYLRDINSINLDYKEFLAPANIKASLQLSKEFSEDFEFLPKVRAIIDKLEKSNIKFIYGCGIEDPHIWNFRIVRSESKIEALTTDFDYFCDTVNCFWELGYLYATIRWFKKTSSPLASQAEKFLLSLVENQNLKGKFMFWLGVLSSYCGYKDSLLNFKINGSIDRLKEQYRIIKQLDDKIYYLAIRLLKEDAS